MSRPSTSTSRFPRRYQNENSPSGRPIKKSYELLNNGTHRYFERDQTPEDSKSENSSPKNSSPSLRKNVIDRISNFIKNQEQENGGNNSSPKNIESLNKAKAILDKLNSGHDFVIENTKDGNEDSENEETPKIKSSKMKSKLRNQNSGTPALKRRNGKPLANTPKNSNSTKKFKKNSPKKNSPRKSQGNGDSPVKTRSNLSEADKLQKRPHCLICEGTDGSFVRCRLCEFRFHPNCIQISPPFLQSKNLWRCFDCIWCAQCKKYIDDHENVQCNRCGQAYHGKCKPAGTVAWYPFKFWRCGDCVKKSKTEEELAFFQKRQISRKLKPSLSSMKNKNNENPKILLFSKKKLPKNGFRSIRNLTTMSLTLPLEESKNVIILPNNKVSEHEKEEIINREFAKQKLNEKLINKMTELALNDAEHPSKEMEDKAMELTEKYSNVYENGNSEMPLTLPYQQIWPTQKFDEKLEEEFYEKINKKSPKSSKSPKKNKKSISPPKKSAIKTAVVSKIGGSSKPSTSKVKTESVGQQMYKYLSQFSFKDVLDKYVKAKRNALEIAKAEEEIIQQWTSELHYDDDINQYLHFGPNYIIPVKKCVPTFDASMKKAPLIFVCLKCFELTLSPLRFCMHLNICKFSCPPGDEIYRETLTQPNGEELTISFFEVKGSQAIDYCRRLCVVASGLLPAKAVTREVELFTFYILTEFHEDAGFVPAGFFSKELKPSLNNNLSCLLVFNHHRSSGYGKLLVDLSYQLSKREKKFGSPEHPLSDDGLHLYRSYWVSRIFEYIRKHRNERKISLEDISKETYIHIDDIVSTLLECRMIKQLDGQKVTVDCSKPWFSDTRLLRRRAINPAELIWESKHEPGEEHNEFYACSSDDDD